jgi:peptidylprolyl isomerase
MTGRPLRQFKYRYSLRTAFDTLEVTLRRLFLTSLLLATSLLSAGAFAAAASAATVALPSVKGGFGASPTVTFPNAAAPTSLQTKILSPGKGDKVSKGELLIVNYLGQIWRGKVFDSSFSRNQTFGTPIGVGAVVKGWDQGLVGQKIGSRVLLSIPPSLGYGTAGNSQAGIKGTDTLVFVVDIVAEYPKTTGSRETTKVLTKSANGITVSNINSTTPTFAIAKGAKKPTAESTTLLARGTGVKVVPGMLVLQYAVGDFTGKTQESTWKTGFPDGEYAGSSVQPGVFDKLIGDPIGSRVLIELPANTNGGPYLLAVQIAAEVPAKASKP